MKYAEIIVDIAHSNIDRFFDYSFTEDLSLEIGDRVRVPFGKTTVEGIVLALKDDTSYDRDKIKSVIEKLDDDSIVNRDQILLCRYLCEKYRTTMAFALRLMYPSKLRGERVHKKLVRVAVLVDESAAMTEKLLCYSKTGVVKAQNRLNTIDTILRERTCPTAILDNLSVKKLAEKGIIRIEEVEQYRSPNLGIRFENRSITYSEDQLRVINEVSENIFASKNDTFLLHGVTGSGKTEVYIALVKKALEAGKSAIVLVPEISITPQILAEFSRHFDREIALFHSGLSDGEKYDEWRRVKTGEAKIVLGARSAIFMPLENIGVIILDEEQSESYRNDNHPSYQASEVGNLRAKMHNCPLVLASATPLIDDYYRAEKDIYRLLEMPKRINNRALPAMRIVDMKNEARLGNYSLLSGYLINKLNETVGRGEQAMLFLNKRGYSTSLICPDCGEVKMCSYCDLPLKYHKDIDKLLCHYCGRTYDRNQSCLKCGSRNFRFVGTGTEKVVEQLQKYLPNARILRMDFDTTRNKDSHQKLFEVFRNHEADILVGTQMIARGLDFPDVTLSAILSADSMLFSGDYRQEERTFAMIEQVAGRSGRHKDGEVVVQTYNPSNYVISYVKNHDYRGFYQDEIGFRKVTFKPPFSRIYRLVFTHPVDNTAKTVYLMAKELTDALYIEHKNDILLYTAKEAPVKKLDNRYRYHIILKLKTNRNLNEIRNKIYDIWDSVKSKKNVTVGFDIDPFDVT